MQGSRKPLRDLFTRLIRQCDIGLGLLLSLIGVCHGQSHEDCVQTEYERVIPKIEQGTAKRIL